MKSMSEKISIISLADLPSKIGSHQFEIVDISTDWCGPCQSMKQAMHKIFETTSFKDKDIQVYVIDGDICSTIERKIAIINDALKEGITFPVSEEEFLKFFSAKINSDNDYTKDEMETITNELLTDLGLERKDGKIYLNDTFEKLSKMEDPTKEFNVDGYPTLILYKDGKPITTPIDEKDYGSRGFYEYDEEACKKDNVDMSIAKIMDIEIEEGKGKKKKVKKVKIIQPNPKCDAKLVGFGGEPELKKNLKKFLSL
jgi:thiol-disulfide isomerase/thioredoxin